MIWKVGVIVFGLALSGCDRGGSGSEGTAAPIENVDRKEKAQAAAITPTEDPIVGEIADYRAEVRRNFEERNFDALESEVAGLRQSRAVFRNGSWKLHQFYQALDLDRDAPDSAWTDQQEMLKEWREARPESAAARIATADFLTSYAWRARGSGYANTVSQRQWQVFAARLESAHDSLKEVGDLDQQDAFFWRAALTVALGQGWDRGNYDELMAAAHEAEPEFWGVDVARAYSLLPRWYGEPGDWEKFAEETSARPEGLGDELYARIVSNQAGFYENVFRETQASWPKTKAGLDAMRLKYPDSLSVLTDAARLGTMAFDQEYAKAAFAELDGRFVEDYWDGGRERFVHFRTWAETGEW